MGTFIVIIIVIVINKN